MPTLEEQIEAVKDRVKWRTWAETCETEAPDAIVIKRPDCDSFEVAAELSVQGGVGWCARSSLGG